jgi:O-acetyl-ADP-ribose deacetylase (regulator of RNase III)
VARALSPVILRSTQQEANHVPGTITVAEGDITQQPDCDGVVNAANSHLLSGGGVCGAIHRAAGPELEPAATALAPVPPGEAVATPGFRLPCGHIIHAVGPRYHQDPDPPATLASAIRRAVEVADSVGVTRLAVPALSTGIYGYPPEEAIPILVAGARDALARATHVREVRFVVLGEPHLGLFLAAIGAEG